MHFPLFGKQTDIRVGKKELTIDNMKKIITKAGNSTIYANDKKQFGIGHRQIWSFPLCPLFQFNEV